jgi:Tfp pilus assembly protein PilN
MRAVNLIPPDLRRATGTPGASGNAVYVLLGVLGVAVVLVAAWALASRSVAQGESDLNRVKAEADAAETRAGQLKPYAAFHDTRVKRVETVTSLSRSRFNWPFALREVSRVLPKEVWLTEVIGTVAPGISLEGGSSAGKTTQLRNALASPAIEIVGCTVSHEHVARYLARLRSVQGVTRVTLAESEKLDGENQAKSGSGGSNGGKSGADDGGNDEDCRRGNILVPRFALIIFFEGSTATPTVGAPGGTTPTAAPAAPKGGSK